MHRPVDALTGTGTVPTTRNVRDIWAVGKSHEQGNLKKGRTFGLVEGEADLLSGSKTYYEFSKVKPLSAKDS